MKVLILAYACEPDQGSEPEIGWQWALQMARFHDVSVITRSNNREGIEKGLRQLAPDQPRPRFFYDDAGPLVLWAKKRFQLHSLYYLLWQRRVRRLVSEVVAQERYDLIHHLTFGALRHPTAIWHHGVATLWGPVGGMSDFPVQLFARSNWRLRANALLRRVDSWVRGRFLGLTRRRGRASSLVLASHPEAVTVFRCCGVVASLFSAIGIEPHLVAAGPRPLRAGPLRLLFVGRLMEEKGVELALEALARTGQELTLTWVGRGPARAQMERLANRLGLVGRVYFAGAIPRDRVIEEMDRHDLFLFPSVYDSGGFAVLEAMARGLPVICLDSGGPAVSLAHGGGIVVPVTTREEVVARLAEAIRRFDEDRTFLHRMSAEARQAILEHHLWEKRSEALSAFYNQATGKGL